jgi:hypothetical protein
MLIQKKIFYKTPPTPLYKKRKIIVISDIKNKVRQFEKIAVLSLL